MADLSLSLEEYNTLRSERDKYKNESETWQKHCQDLSANKIGVITRYDRIIPDDVIRAWAKEVWLRIVERIDNKNRSFSMGGLCGRLNDYYNSSMFTDERLAEKVIEEELIQFITDQCNTNNRSNISISTNFTNIDTIIDNVKKIWDDKFQKEYSEKVKETEQKNTEAKALVKKEKEKLAKLEKKFENDIYSKDEKIRYLNSDYERALKRIDKLNSMLAESDRKYLQESMENAGLKDTIYNQKEKIDIIKALQKTWWWKMFGPKIEF